MVGQKVPPTSFCPIPSTKVGVSPPNFLTFTLNHLATRKSQGHIYCQSDTIELEPQAPLKKRVFSGQILIKLKL